MTVLREAVRTARNIAADRSQVADPSLTPTEDHRGVAQLVARVVWEQDDFSGFSTI